MAGNHDRAQPRIVDGDGARGRAVQAVERSPYRQIGARPSITTSAPRGMGGSGGSGSSGVTGRSTPIE